MFDLALIQSALQDLSVDGWLLYDFRGINVLAQRVLGLADDAIATRRFFYYIPAEGTPQKLLHRIETEVLDHLPGETRTYLRWGELEAGLATLVQDANRIAMEYSPNNANPYVSRVDAGTVELVRSRGVDVVSSGDLVQQFEATWDDDQWEMHLKAASLTDSAFRVAWDFIRDRIASNAVIRETDVQEVILAHFAEHSMVTDHPPIVATRSNAANPHYVPSRGTDSEINPGDLVLVDLWGKLDQPRAVYSDQTRMAIVDETVGRDIEEIFEIVIRARDAAITLVEQAFREGRDVRGWEVDQAARGVITAAGYGDYFIHRTGHNIGQETHGNGAHIDDLETHEDRLIIRRTCFSIEPGIYLDKFGVRSEVDVFVDANGEVHVTGGDRQTCVETLL